MEKEIEVWVARDMNGTLCFHSDIPERLSDSEWLSCDYYILNSDLYPEITWESEPVKKTIIIKD